MSGAQPLLAPLFHGAAVGRIFSPERQLAAMVHFELALAVALETVGIAPAGTGEACARGAEGFPSFAEVEAIAQGAVTAGNLAIPFVQQLTAAVRRSEGNAADFIHYGATSQDLLDTATVLQLLEFRDLVLTLVRRVCEALVTLTQAHRDTLLPGRTWLQQGPPVTFGLKTAGWLAAMLRHRERVVAAFGRVCVLQFGGAVGTLASLGEHGPALTEALGQELGLAVPDVPWHSHRDSFAEAAAVSALLVGTLGKIARDLSLQLQNEVAEIRIEGPGGAGGSSTMPHKRNPVTLAVVLAAAVRAPGLVSTMMSAMVQEHERGLGGWHAEWETLPELCRITSGALEAMAVSLEGLGVDEAAMRSNLDRLHGVTLAEAVSMRLAASIGRPAAHRLLEAASKEALRRGVDLRDVLRQEAQIVEHLSPAELESALDPAKYLGSAGVYVDRVLARAAAMQKEEASNAVC